MIKLEFDVAPVGKMKSTIIGSKIFRTPRDREEFEAELQLKLSQGWKLKSRFDGPVGLHDDPGVSYTLEREVSE